ncbi:probable WRKY transcription factor protein 1 isoform X2 [Tigriopus californicus]|uniref:probable WRKY transcription factor protein 1 isoform X2 n=1 Tax=Tigriopus californicus TaxID=6832 RepID=UPI0027DA92A0|nr:probable WRKY transcription factor protein 1 isoform X2 [Tigriopus californicus]
MLLCCFKEKKSKRNSYDVNHRHDMPSTKRDSALLEPAYQPTRNSIISDRSVTPPSAKRRDWKERAPLQREEKKLMKQRSRDSFSRDDPTLSFPYIDSSTTTTNNEEIGSPGVRSDKFLTSSYASSYSSPINNNKIGSAENNYNHRAQPEIIRISSSTLSSPSKPNYISSTTASVKSVPNLSSNPSMAPLGSLGSSPVHSIHSTNSLQLNHNNNLNQVVMGLPPTRPIPSSSSLTKKDKVQGRGMTRSSASYGIQQLLQEQIIQEERAKDEEKINEQMQAASKAIESKYEAQINELKNQHNQRVQELERTYRISLNNAKNKNESELKWKVTKYEHELESCRKSHQIEMDDAKKKFDQSLNQEKEELKRLAAEYNAKDEAWKKEKMEVFGEIQRLKDEANRFIAILSAEDESDEHLSPERRQTLTREVESLQLVVEMRTQEVHRLREEQAKHLAKLEELDTTKESLAKMKAKVEDLQAQLDRKNESARQLSREKSNLENNFELQSKNKAIISQQMEELQWRIKHKMELPPLKVYQSFHESKEVTKEIHSMSAASQEFETNKSRTKKYQIEPMQKETLAEALPTLSEPIVEAPCDIGSEVNACLDEVVTVHAPPTNSTREIPVTLEYTTADVLPCQITQSSPNNNNNSRSNNNNNNNHHHMNNHNNNFIKHNNNSLLNQKNNNESSSPHPDLILPVMEDPNQNEVKGPNRHSLGEEDEEEEGNTSDENANDAERLRKDQVLTDSLERVDNIHHVVVVRGTECTTDEGLGDISSSTPSPQPVVDARRKKSILMEESKAQKEAAVAIPPSSPSDERMPSRIPLSVGMVP